MKKFSMNSRSLFDGTLQAPIMPINMILELLWNKIYIILSR